MRRNSTINSFCRVIAFRTKTNQYYMYIITHQDNAQQNCYSDMDFDQLRVYSVSLHIFSFLGPFWEEFSLKCTSIGNKFLQLKPYFKKFIAKQNKMDHDRESVSVHPRWYQYKSFAVMIPTFLNVQWPNHCLSECIIASVLGHALLAILITNRVKRLLMIHKLIHNDHIITTWILFMYYS